MSIPLDPASAKIEKELAIVDGSKKMRFLIYWL
jgi:hypothetical protein